MLPLPPGPPPVGPASGPPPMMGPPGQPPLPGPGGPAPMPGPQDPISALSMAAASLQGQEQQLQGAATTALMALMQQISAGPSAVGQAAMTAPGPAVATPDDSTAPA